jgi:hypothetical protein
VLYFRAPPTNLKADANLLPGRELQEICGSAGEQDHQRSGLGRVLNRWIYLWITLWKEARSGVDNMCRVSHSAKPKTVAVLTVALRSAGVSRETNPEALTVVSARRRMDKNRLIDSDFKGVRTRFCLQGAWLYSDVQDLPVPA